MRDAANCRDRRLSSHRYHSRDTISCKSAVELNPDRDRPDVHHAGAPLAGARRSLSTPREVGRSTRCRTRPRPGDAAGTARRKMRSDPARARRSVTIEPHARTRPNRSRTIGRRCRTNMAAAQGRQSAGGAGDRIRACRLTRQPRGSNGYPVGLTRQRPVRSRATA